MTESVIEKNLKQAISGRYEFIDAVSAPIKYGTRIILCCPIHGRGDEFGTPWIPIAGSVISGYGCPKCAGKYRYTLKEYVDAVELRGYNFVSLLDGFQGIQSKVVLSCPVHGKGTDFERPWTPSFNNLISHNKGCPKCAGVYKRTLKEWIEVVNATKYHFVGVIGKFSGKRTRINVSCPVHGCGNKFGRPWIPRFEDLLRGNGCPKCAGLYNSSASEYKSLVEHTTPYKLVNYIEPIKGKHTCVNLRCPTHGEGQDFGTPWLPSLNNLLKGGRCPKCQKRYVYTLNEITEKITEMSYELIDFKSTNFQGVKSRVSIKCNEPHEDNSPFIWETTPDALFSGRKCPACSGASGGFSQLKPAFLYLHKIFANGDLIALKIGITNREPLLRMAQQSNWTEFTHIIVATIYSDSGTMIYGAEKELLSSLKLKNSTGVLTKDMMKDGFTETIAASELDKLLARFKSLGSEKGFIFEEYHL